MLAGMPASTLAEWMAYDSIEPFGEQRAELRHGQSMALTANINRGKDSKPFTALDFMNYTDRPEKPEATPEDNYARIDREVFGL